MRKATGYITGFLLAAFFFSPIAPVQAQHEHGASPAPAVEDREELGETFRLCSPEHMQMMLENPEDQECVAEEVLRNEATADIIMNKIMQDPALHRKMMQKMHAQMQKRMMEHEGMMNGEGGMMHGERMKDMMRDRELMQQDRKEQESEKGGAS